jgi:hypothetical protein
LEIQSAFGREQIAEHFYYLKNLVCFRGYFTIIAFDGLVAQLVEQPRKVSGLVRGLSPGFDG